LLIQLWMKVLKNGYSDYSPHYNQSRQLSAQPPKKITVFVIEQV